MLPSSSDLPQKSIQIKQDDKLFSSREISMANSSLEVYYGGASVAVPFIWESQPGTPKMKFRGTPLPPLTPPPSNSYHFNATKKPIKKHSRPNLLRTFLPKLTLRKTHIPPFSASSSSSLSSSSSSSSLQPSSHSVPSSPITPSNFRGQFSLSRPKSSFESRVDEEDHEYGSPASTLCFGMGRGTNARFRGCYSSMIKVFLGDFP